MGADVLAVPVVKLVKLKPRSKASSLSGKPNMTELGGATAMRGRITVQFF
jgi:hypothetical protein